MRLSRRIAATAAAVVAAGAGLLASAPLASAQTPGDLKNFFGYCLTASGPIVAGTGITAATASCSSTDGNQDFTMSPDGFISDASGFCLGVLNLTPGTLVASDFSCNTSSGFTQWQYDSSAGGLLELQADPFLCLSSSTPGRAVRVQTCDQVASQTVTWQIPTGSIAQWSPGDVAQTIPPGSTGTVYLSINSQDGSFTDSSVTFGAPSTFSFTGATALPSGCGYALPNGSGGFNAITCRNITLPPGGNYFQGPVQVLVSPTAPENTLLVGTSSFASTNGPTNGNTSGSFAVATSPLLDLTVAGLTLTAAGSGWMAWWLVRRRRRTPANA